MKASRLLPMMAAAALALPASAHAFGFGAYFEYGGGNTADDIEYDADDGGLLVVDQDSQQFGFGVVFDTAVAEDTLINYRGSLGAQFRDIDANVRLVGPRGLVSIEQDVDQESAGVAFDNVLGFGLIRTSDVRLWVGPALRLGADFFDGDDSGNGDRVDFNVGIGPEVGLNIHTGDLVSVGLTAGYLYNFVFSAIDIDDDGDFSNNNDGFDDTGDGREHLFFGRVNLLFRFSDRY